MCLHAVCRMKQQSTTIKKVDEVIKNARKTGKRTKRNLKKFVRGTVLPLMSKITTQKEGASDSESINSATISPKKKGKELSDQKDGSKIDTDGDISFSPEKKGYREKTTNPQVENNTDASIIVEENISEAYWMLDTTKIYNVAKQLESYFQDLL